MVFEKAVQDLEKNGFAVIENFLSEEDMNNMKEEIRKLVDAYDPQSNKCIFLKSKSVADKYFMDSSEEVNFFLEEGVLDKNGKLNLDKQISVNQMGHALHWRDEVFKKVTFSDKVKTLVKELGYKDPAVIQGMYIFKQAGRGGEVAPHQDATYLNTDPVRVVGLWFPMQDATQENGCLFFQPGSHKGKLYSRWVRTNDENGPSMKFIDDEKKAEVYGDESKYVPGNAPKGSCVLIDGLVIHKSSKNTSPFPRPAYTFHLYDRGEAEWSKDNWTQPTKNNPYPNMFEVEA